MAKVRAAQSLILSYHIYSYDETLDFVPPCDSRDYKCLRKRHKQALAPLGGRDFFIFYQVLETLTLFFLFVFFFLIKVCTSVTQIKKIFKCKALGKG